MHRRSGQGNSYRKVSTGNRFHSQDDVVGINVAQRQTQELLGHNMVFMLCAGDTPTVKGSGTLSINAFMQDYLRNLSAQATGPVLYTYDPIGDVQGRECFWSHGI